MSAEKSLQSVSDKAYAWSPTLRNKAIIRQYWRLRLREADFAETWGRTFDRWTSQIQTKDATFTLPLRRDVITREEISKHFTVASREFRKCQRNATDHRHQSYHDLMLFYEDDDNPDTRKASKRKMKILQCTILAENQRHIHKSLGQIVKPSSYTPLDKIQIPR